MRRFAYDLVLFVFQLAEKMGLAHISKGSDSDRHIEVFKPGAESQSLPFHTGRDAPAVDTRSKVPSNASSVKPESKSQTRTAESILIESGEENLSETKVISEADLMNTIGEVEKETGKVACKWCNKDVIKANIQLHELGCPKNINRNRKPCSASSNKQPSVAESSASRRFDKELKKKVNAVDDDDIDALIATVKKMDNFCCFKKCKISVLTLCNVCSFCQGRYCMSHHMPEIHGCGDAARAEARARISKEGVLYRGSGVPTKKPDVAKKAQLQRKLDSKLGEMSAKRKIKQKK